MYRITASILSTLLILALSTPAAAQIVVPEEVSSQCSGRPFADRVRLAVARFSQSTSGSNSANIDNFSTMLSNAMFEIDCFRMMEMLEDQNWDFGPDDAGSRIRPHLIVTGEITEYDHDTREEGNFIRKKTIVTAHLGFVLQIKDPVTREIFFSKSFNQEGSSENSDLEFEVGGVEFSRSSNESVDGAYFDAFEKGILDAVTYIVENEDRIYEVTGVVMTQTEAERAAEEAEADALAALNSTAIRIDGVTFTSLGSIEDVLESLEQVQGIGKTLNGDVGTLQVEYFGEPDALVEAILGSGLGEFEVVAFQADAIRLRLSGG